MTIVKSRKPPAPQARFTSGATLFQAWRDEIYSGEAPVVFQHAFPYPEIGPGLVTLIGGPPGEGKTAFTMMMVIEALRYDPGLRAVVASCEMAPECLLDRQLARLAGIDAEVIRHRAFGPEHDERLAAGLATLESLTDRVAFMHAPFDIRNVAASVDDFGARLVIIDYIQRFTVPTEDLEARHRVSRTMDYLRQFADAGVAVIVVSAVGRTKDRAGRSSYAGDGLSLASFRETSELEYGADDALILSAVGADEPDVVRLSHLKARHGRQVHQEFRFDRGLQSFTLLSDAGPLADLPARPEKTKCVGQTKSVSDEIRLLWESSPAANEDEVPDVEE